MFDDSIFKVLRSSRQNLAKILDESDRDTLLKIPEGIGNNILWNIGHIIMAQQGLCYSVAKLPLRFLEEERDLLKKGSSPKDWTEASNNDRLRETIRKSILTSIDTLEKDLKADLFKEYAAYTTSSGVTLNSVWDAVAFSLFHEGLHMQAIRGIQRAASKH